MAHFARLDENNIVTQVIVVNNECCTDPTTGEENEALGIQFLTEWSGGHTNWRQTSCHNTFRKRFACVGGKYDVQRDIFIDKSPFPSWSYNYDSDEWRPPVEYPGGDFYWDELAVTWQPYPPRP